MLHDAIAASTPMVYVYCDVPEGLTLRDWRRGHDVGGATVSPLSSVVRRARRARRSRRERAGSGGQQRAAELG